MLDEPLDSEARHTPRLGIDLTGIPRADEVAAAMRRIGFTVELSRT